MTKDDAAQEVVKGLIARSERVVFAESCTCGMLAATLGGIPGVSNYLCGSAVTYRADTKRRWLKVRKGTVKRHTTESHATAREMAIGSLVRTPEADWSVAVVGHLGPDAPEEKDGLLYICIARRTKKRNIKIKDASEHKLGSKERGQRQEEATEVALTKLHRAMAQMSKNNEAGGGNGNDTHANNGKPKGKKKRKQTA